MTLMNFLRIPEQFMSLLHSSQNAKTVFTFWAFYYERGTLREICSLTKDSAYCGGIGGGDGGGIDAKCLRIVPCYIFV